MRAIRDQILLLQVLGVAWLEPFARLEAELLGEDAEDGRFAGARRAAQHEEPRRRRQAELQRDIRALQPISHLVDLLLVHGEVLRRFRRVRVGEEVGRRRCRFRRQIGGGNRRFCLAAGLA